MSTIAALTQALADRYTIERELGQGGMATVYLADDLRHGRQVALKVLRPELAATLGSERFFREIQVAARLQHPHILPLHDSGEAGGFLFFVMPYVQGESLRQRLARVGELPVHDAVKILVEVVDALAYAHSQGVVHRDIKPDNVMLSGRHALVTDFGVAKAVSEATGRQALTTAGVALGTPAYMAPEQAAADPNLDHRVDIYAVGAMAYELLTGRPPFTGMTSQQILSAHVTQAPDPVSRHRPACPPGLEAVIMRCLAKRAADRWQTAEELLQHLEPLATPSGGMTPTHTRPVEALRIVTTTRWFAVAGVALLVAVGMAGWAVLRGRAPAPSPLASAVPTQITTSGGASSPLLSPDGSLLAYTEERCQGGRACTHELIVREVSGEGVTTLFSDTTNVAGLAWSPDSRYLAYATRAGVFVVPQRGGTARRVLGGGEEVFGGFTSPDTIVLARPRGNPHWLRRIAVSSGQMVDSLLLPTKDDAAYVVPSPDGRYLLLVTFTEKSRPGGDALPRAVTLDSRARVLDTLVVDDLPRITSAAWGAGSAQLFFSLQGDAPGLTIVRRNLDGRGRLRPGVDTIRALPEWGEFGGVSPDGRVLAYTADRLGETRLLTATRRDPRGPFSRGRQVATTTGLTLVFISPGGRWIILRENLSTPSGQRSRFSVEPFDGGESHVVEPATPLATDFAASPGDDSLALATAQGDDRFEISIYPLPTGSPVRRGVYRDAVGDLEWTSGGSLTTPSRDGHTIRVFDRTGAEDSIPVPDSLGRLVATARSPTVPALAVVTRRGLPGREEYLVSRLDLPERRFTVLNRSAVALQANSIWWTRDGWVHVETWRGRDQGWQLSRVPETGGALESEPAVDFEPGAEVSSMAHDGKRAVVRVRNSTTDLWLLKAAGPAGQ